jgi:Pyridoxamine 5'-phosphate oxidase
MGKIYAQIDEKLHHWLQRQRLFFVATAPRSEEGLLNCSPKGGDCFRVIDPRTVMYRDLVGSGVETIAHLRENGRIVLMFCEFETAPLIVRLHGRGEVVEPHHPEFEALNGQFPPGVAVRSIIRVTLGRISDSCGFGVPVYKFVNERRQLVTWAERKGVDGVQSYKLQYNRRSIDGLPGVEDIDGP